MPVTDRARLCGFLPRERLGDLFAVLRTAGYRLLGPQVRHGAILYDDIDGPDSLPQGWEDQQGPGEYRLQQHASPRQFAWAVGPQALKPNLFVPREVLWTVQRAEAGGLRFDTVLPAGKPLAVVGMRACDLAALQLQDAHFLGSTPPDPQYQARRAGLFLVAVNCTHPAATCFCASTGDGPAANGGCDLILDELDDGFLVQRIGARAEAVVAELAMEPATPTRIEAAEQQRVRAGERQRRRLPSRDLRALFAGALEHPHWAEVAERCLSCGNCTSVCPTCFCHSRQDDARLDGSGSAHYRQWDSCFTAGHSYIHGITVRKDTRLRYRQWLTHKLGSWHDQYGRSGCVGCGRCISWCPVGIDLTDEVAALAEEAV